MKVFIILIAVIFFNSCINKEENRLKIITNSEFESINEYYTDEQQLINSTSGLTVPFPFIEAVRSGNKNEILKFLRYPIARPFPSPYIQNEQEMIEKFDIIFTNELKNSIAGSSWNNEWHWRSEAWRGIVFATGVFPYLWMDYDGMVFRLPPSKQELELSEAFWIQDRARLLPEFQLYDGNLGLFASLTYLIRVDYFNIEEDYHNKYRALLWERKNNKTLSNMPDIILTDGIISFSGSYPVGKVYFMDNNRVYIIDLPDYDHYGYKGELFIGEYSEPFNPWEDRAWILTEEFTWVKI